MNRIFYDFLDDSLVLYMDGLLIFRKDEQSHLRRIELVLSLPKDHELLLSPKKCEILKEEIAFLGLTVRKNGLRVDPKKVDMLKSWPKPSTLTGVR